VARPAFEASPAGRRHPQADGVTRPVIRRAVGLWAREAIVRWNREHPGTEHLLVGETPFVGGRLIELARPLQDAAEGLLADASCRFALALPSAGVRRHLEAERGRRAEHPLHPREREDAPPHVLSALWREIAGVAGRLGVAPPGDAARTPYDPVWYRSVYERILRHRRVDVVALDVILPAEALSPYDFAAPPPDLIPSEAEAERFVEDVERRYPAPAALDEEIARWWEV